MVAQILIRGHSDRLVEEAQGFFDLFVGEGLGSPVEKAGAGDLFLCRTNQLVVGMSSEDGFEQALGRLESLVFEVVFDGRRGPFAG